MMEKKDGADMKVKWNNIFIKKQKAATTDMTWWLFLFCFVSGIVLANLYGRMGRDSDGIFDVYFLERLIYASEDKSEVMYQVIRTRMPWLLGMLFLALTSYGIWSCRIYLSWQGISLGFLMASLVFSYGIKGIWLTMIALFPHYLCYIPVFIFLLLLSKESRNSHFQGKTKGILIGSLLAAFCVFCIGMVLESQLNPIIIKEILKKF